MSGDIKKPGGGHGCAAFSSVNSEAHDRSDAAPNAAQHVGVVLACPLFFHIPHHRNKLWSALNHHKGGLLDTTCLSRSGEI